MNENWKNPQINRLGERAVLVSWPEEINEKRLYFMLRAKEEILKHSNKVILELTNTYNSLLIRYNKPINKIYSLKKGLKAVFSTLYGEENFERRSFELPVCYDREFGWDLTAVARQKKRSVQSIIELHSKPVYTVYFIGFLPGFLYLGGLDKRLAVSRQKEPRLSVQKGAVGLAENQTGIYPQKSAGGWQIIGSCPLPFFDPKRNPPCPFRPGDQLKFTPISRSEYRAISNAVSHGQYEVNPKKQIK